MKVKSILTRITDEEAVAFMEKENGVFNMTLAHKGFISEGEFPFAMSKIINGVTIWPPVDIHPCAKIGKGCMLGRYTNICGDIKMGENVRVQGFCYIPDSVEIGDRVFIGPNVTFTNMKYPKVRGSMFKTRDGIIKIEDDVNIGAGCIIGPGVRIAKGVTVGMGSVVTRDVKEEGGIYFGTPARLKRV